MKTLLAVIISTILIGCAGIPEGDDQEPAGVETETPRDEASVEEQAPQSDAADAAADQTPDPNAAATAAGQPGAADTGAASATEASPDTADPAADGAPPADTRQPDPPTDIAQPPADATAADAAAADEPATEIVFDSSAVPMIEPADEGLTFDLSTSAEPEVLEPPPPLPDPLNSRQISNSVFSQIGNGLLPVHKSGTALYLLHDIDNNGYGDVFALAVRGDEREAAEFANVHDYTRLYRAEREAARFYLRLFYQRNGTLVPADLVSLGERLVVDSFRPLAIVEGKNSPFAVSIVFTTLQGRVREWVIFAGEKPSRFSMQERTGEIPRIEDIDSNGVIDVVIYEETFEIGIGNETYLTWFGWNGSEFSKRATVNVVRNLREFLNTAFESIRDGDWSTFSRKALTSSVRETIPTEELAGFGIFHRVFALVAADESFRNQPVTKGEEIRRTVYPEIRENPFSQRDSLGFFFPLTIRFETTSGRNHLYTTRVYMFPNPFGGEQFTFSPVSNNG